MTCRDAAQNRSQHPWTFTAVCVMVVSTTLLLFGLSEMTAFQLLPGYVAAYLLIGFCIFGPVGKPPLLRQATAFLLPGALLLVLALLDMGLWAGGWLLGLPAWGVLLSRWTPEHPLMIGQLLKFLGLLVLGLVIFTLNMIYFPAWVCSCCRLFPSSGRPTRSIGLGRCRRSWKYSWESPP